jgi:hypothetical protein
MNLAETHDEAQPGVQSAIDVGCGHDSRLATRGLL